jgi:hypothetical protein
VDVAHEALIRHWRLLRQWIEQNRDLLRQQRRIEASAVAWQEHQQSKGYLLQGLPLDEAMQFQEAAGRHLSPSPMRREPSSKRVAGNANGTELTTASWLILPALVVVGIVEHSIREESVKSDYGRLDSDSKYEEKQAVANLVKGCREQQNVTWLPSYLAERLFGNCRTLARAPLKNANLVDVDLRDADLRDANLSYASLIDADLRYTNLRYADLSNADLSNANLDSASLHDANLSYSNLSYADLS